MSLNLGDAVGKIILDSSGFTAGVNKVASACSKMQNSTDKVSNGLKSVGSSLTSVGSDMTKKVTVPIVAAGAAIVKTTATFESKMSKVKALSGSTGEELSMLTDRAKEMGAKTKFSASEAADAMSYMALAGWDAKQMYDGIPAVMNLAAAAGEDLANVSDILTDNISAFGLSVKDSDDFANVLAATMSKSNTTVGMLGESFKYCASAAGAMGYDYRDVSVALGIMANGGIKASQAGTTLRAVMNRLATNAGATKTSLGALDVLTERLGVQFYDTQGNARDLSDVLEECRAAWKGLSDEEQANYAKKIAGQNAISGFLLLMNAENEEWSNLSNEINNASNAYDGQGMAAGQAQEMLNNLDGQVTILKSTLESLAISLGELMLPTVKSFVENIQGLVEKFNSLDDEQKKQIIKFAAIAAAVGPVILIVGKLCTSLGSIVSVSGNVIGGISRLCTSIGTKMATSMTLMNESVALSNAGFSAFAAQAKSSALAVSPLGSAIGALTSPIALAIAAIALLSGAFITLWKTNEDFKNNITEIWDNIVSKFQDFSQGIVDRLNELGFEFEDILDIIKTIWFAFCDVLAPVFEGAFKQIENTLSAVFDVILGILDIFIGIFTGDWDKCWKGIKEVFSSIANLIVNQVKNFVNTQLNVLNVFLGWIGTSWQECWNGVKKFFSNIAKSISNAVSDFVQDVIKFFKDLPKNIKTFIDNTIDSVTTFASNMARKATETGKNFLNNIVNFVEELPYKIGYIIGTVIGKAISFANDMKNKAKTAGKNFLDNVVNFIKDLPGNIKTLFENAVKNATSFANDMKDKAIELGKNFVNNIITFISQLPGKIITFFVNVINNTISFANDMKNKAIGLGTNFVNSIVTFVSELPGKIQTLFGNVIDNVITFASNMKNKGAEAANNLKDAVINGIKELPSKVTEVGKNVVEGLWNGISGASDWIKGKVGEFANGILDGMKDTLGIHSPSRRAKKEIGEQVAQGVINGVKAKKGAAKKSASELSQIIVDAATEKLDKLTTFNKISEKQEVNYWKRVLKSCKKGSTAYLTAYKNLQSAKEKVQSTTLSKAEKKWEKITLTAEKSAKQEASYWKRVMSRLNKNSEEYLTAYKNYLSALDNINGEKLSNAQDVFDRYSMFYDISAKQEAMYWRNVMNTLDKGSSEYMSAYKNYTSAKDNMDAELLNNAKTYYDNYTTYNEMTLNEEVRYWDSVRKMFEEGTEERIAADKEYLQAKENLQAKEIELDEQYASDVADVYEDLNDKIDDLTAEYNDALQNRVDNLLSAFSLFESYKIEDGASADELISNLNSQVDALQQYEKEMDSLKNRGILSESLVNEISDMGLDALGEIKSLNTMTDEQLLQFAGLYEEKVRLATQQAEKELKPLKDSVEKSIEEVKGAADIKLKELEEVFTQQLNDIMKISTEISKQIGNNIVSGITNTLDTEKETLNKALKYILNDINNTFDKIASKTLTISTTFSDATFSVNGSHKNGLGYVPYDGYIAELHEGERVLTKEEARRQDSNSVSGDTFIFNSPTAIDEKEAARQIRRVKKELALGF